MKASVVSLAIIGLGCLSATWAWWQYCRRKSAQHLAAEAPRKRKTLDEDEELLGDDQKRKRIVGTGSGGVESVDLLVSGQQPLAMSMGSLEADKLAPRTTLAGSGGSGDRKAAAGLHKSGHRKAPEAKLAMVGSVPDISASWSAKVAVTMEQQADASLMGKAYKDMAETFVSQGLNLAAIKATRQYFADLDKPGTAPRPLRYTQFPTPLEPGAVRLGVFLLSSVPRLAEQAAEATEDVFKALPQGMQPHASAQTNLHLTIFMTSQPSDPRPDPFAADGGIDLQAPPHPIPAPIPGTLQKEVALFRSLAADTAAPRFEVHSLVFANSGTLLLCFVDTSARLAPLRTRLRAAFPGASAKQSSIMHVTLGRMLALKPLSKADTAAVQAMCDKWTERLRGTEFVPDALWHVQELTFTSVDGTKERLALQAI